MAETLDKQTTSESRSAKLTDRIFTGADKTLLMLAYHSLINTGAHAEPNNKKLLQ